MIFVTNDDGIESAGLKALVEALESLDEVFIVAPDRERSGIAMAITLYRPLRAKQVANRAYAVDGTPVDCVRLAVGALLPERPKLLVSGINQGQNLGQDLHFSGTVAAAKKGTYMGVPSIAVSLVSGPIYHYGTAASIACRIANQVITNRLPDQILLNVNVPNCTLSKLRGIKMTRQDPEPYCPQVIKRLDHQGKPYYWIGGKRKKVDPHEDTDINAIRNQCVSITPVQLDFTAHHLIDPLERWLNDETIQ